MYNNRNLAAPCTNNQGKLNSLEADRIANQLMTGAEYDNIFGAWDYHRIARMSSGPGGAVDVPLMKCIGYSHGRATDELHNVCQWCL